MKGFTLLEILVSMTILSITMASIYGAYTSNAEVIQLARHHAQASQTARIILDRMGKDLESAIVAGGFGMDCESREIEGRRADSLNFAALTPILFGDKGPRTDLCEIGYRLEEGPEGEGFILYRRERGIIADGVTGEGAVYELARMVAGLDITFKDRHGEELEEWKRGEGDENNTLPSLIHIRLTLRDELGRERLFVTSIHPELAKFKE